MAPWVFDSWESLGRTTTTGLLAYVALVARLCVSGKRTLSKMNAFDFVVTIAFGSLLATITLSRTVPLVDGVLALALLVGAQYCVTWWSVRSKRFQSAVKASPTLLLHHGRFLDQALRTQRVTREEVLAAIRGSGAASPHCVGAVVLETEGTLTVLRDLGDDDGTAALRTVSNIDALPDREGTMPSPTIAR